VCTQYLHEFASTGTAAFLANLTLSA